jgi:hypothetical protein
MGRISHRSPRQGPVLIARWGSCSVGLRFCDMRPVPFANTKASSQGLDTLQHSCTWIGRRSAKRSSCSYYSVSLMYECHFFSTHAREDRRIVAEDQTKTSIVHLRTLSDNTPHPKAVNHTLHIPSDFSPQYIFLRHSYNHG